MLGNISASSFNVTSNTTVISGKINVSASKYIVVSSSNTTVSGSVYAGSFNVSGVNFFVPSGGLVNVSGLGYVGGLGGYGSVGSGPGAGGGTTSQAGGGGAGHGGAGGGTYYASAGGVYDSVCSPSVFGSGGGGGYYGSGGQGAGGYGGGSVYVSVSGVVGLNGTVDASGISYPAYGYGGCYYSGGGGAGGSVYLIADTFSGSGTISANGASAAPDTLCSSYNGGGGGGGRISINYNSGSLTGGMVKNSGTGYSNGQNGSLFRCANQVSGVWCPGSGSGIILNSNYSISSNTEINRTIVNWNGTFIRWNESSINTTNNVNYSLSGLLPSATYNVNNTGARITRLTTDSAGNLPVFNITLSSQREVILEEGTTPVLYLNSPANNTPTLNPTPDFNFTVNGSSMNYSCTLYITDTAYGTNATVRINTPAIITANSSLAPGSSYSWYVNCTSEFGITNKSESRVIVTDVLAPYWLNSATNASSSTRVGYVVQFNITWRDDVNLSSYIFSWNDSGSWVNTSASFSGTERNVSVNKTVNATVGMQVCWTYYANDTAGNMNQSGVWCYTLNNTPPNVPAFNSPANGTNYSVRYALLNWTCTDQDRDNMTA